MQYKCLLSHFRFISELRLHRCTTRATWASTFQHLTSWLPTNSIQTSWRKRSELKVLSTSRSKVSRPLSAKISTVLKSRKSDTARLVSPASTPSASTFKWLLSLSLLYDRVFPSNQKLSCSCARTMLTHIDGRELGTRRTYAEAKHALRVEQRVHNIMREYTVNSYKITIRTRRLRVSSDAFKAMGKTACGLGCFVLG